MPALHEKARFGVDFWKHICLPIIPFFVAFTSHFKRILTENGSNCVFQQLMPFRGLYDKIYGSKSKNFPKGV